MASLILIPVFLFCLSLASIAQDEIWTRETDMLIPASHVGAAIIDGKFYLIGAWVGKASRFFQVSMIHR